MHISPGKVLSMTVSIVIHSWIVEIAIRFFLPDHNFHKGHPDSVIWSTIIATVIILLYSTHVAKVAKIVVSGDPKSMTLPS